MDHLTSVNNQQVKNWKKLNRKKERTKKGAYLIEGFHLVEEALKHKKESILHIMLRDDLVNDEIISGLAIDSEKLIVINEKIAEEIADTETNQGIFAELKIEPLAFPKSITGPILVLDAVQDPGNVGTMIRTADAADFQGVFLGKGTVDLYNAKTLRSAQGSHFHLEIYEGDIQEFARQFKEKSYPVLGTALNEAAVSYKEISVKSPFALLVGNEGAGIDEKLMESIDQNIYIPMRGEAESLNVAIAASVLMFHLNE